MNHTSASNVVQYNNKQQVTGGLISYLVWQDMTGLWMLVGGGLINGSELWIALAARNGEVALIPDLAGR